MTSRISAFFCLVVIVWAGIACNKDKTEPDNVQKIESNTTSRLNRVEFINDSVCIVGGGERFLKAEIIVSNDGGKTFSVTSYPEAGKGMYGMATAQDGTTYLTGFDGKLMVSKDMGTTWSFHQVYYWRFYNAIAFTTERKCILVATAAQASGSIVRIDSNYNIVDTSYFKFGLNDIAMPTLTTGYVAGFGVLLKTTDGGNSWQYMTIKNDNFTAISCLSEQELWVCGYRGTIFHTADGGNSWEKLRNGNSLVQKNFLFLDILFKDKTTGWACGEKGLLVYTTDGGRNWKEYKKFTDDALRGMALAPDGNLVVVGDNGSIYKVNRN